MEIAKRKRTKKDTYTGTFLKDISEIKEPKIKARELTKEQKQFIASIPPKTKEQLAKISSKKSENDPPKNPLKPLKCILKKPGDKIKPKRTITLDPNYTKSRDQPENLSTEKTVKAAIPMQNSIPDFDRILGNTSKIKWIENILESEIAEIYMFLKSKILPTENNRLQYVFSLCDKYIIFHEIVYFIKSDGTYLLFIPPFYRIKLLRDTHSSILSGHFSGKKMFANLFYKYYWPSMRKDCDEVAMECEACLRTRMNKQSLPPLTPFRTRYPLELICIDLMDLGKTTSGNKYALILIDHFSKFCIGEPIPDKNSQTVATQIVNSFFLKLGTPEKMHSDGGPEFINSIFKEIQEILNVERSVTPAYHPNFNGACERVNQTIQKIIQRHRTLRSKYEWDELLPYAICAYNLSVHTTTNFPPFVLFFGRPFLNPEAPPYQPIEFPKYTIDIDTYLQNFRELWSEIVNEAVENSDEARQKFKNYFDKSNKTIPSKFKVGDNVMLLPPKLKPQLARDKTKPKATGPYIIIEIGNATAKIRMLNKNCRGVTLDNVDDKFELKVLLIDL